MIAKYYSIFMHFSFFWKKYAFTECKPRYSSNTLVAVTGKSRKKR